MAATRIIPLHAGKGRTVGKAIRSIIDYVKNPIWSAQQVYPSWQSGCWEKCRTCGMQSRTRCTAE